MSTALAIASVTYVLKDLLNNGLIDKDITGTVGTNVLVTALPPDRIETGATVENTQLNLFMYMATPNTGWRNQGLPALSSQGDRLTNPPLALDLHYLLTAYGSEELHHEILIGYGMQLFHETPVLTRDAIRKSLPSAVTGKGADLPPNLRILSTSGLADQLEQIKITPEVLSTEEISKLWAAFGTKYRSTAAYKATVVLIESNKSVKPSLPVQERRIYAVPFRQLSIEKISSQAEPGAIISDTQKILTDYNLVLTGTQFTNEIVAVKIDDTEIKMSNGNVTDSQITVSLPTDLAAGVHSVQVIHKLMIGTPPSVHEGTSSNIQVFMLSPKVNNLEANDVKNDGSGLKSATIKMTVTPAVTATQKISLLLNELNNATTTPLSYNFPLPADNAVSSQNITIPVNGVKAATYLLRIRVDGAESPLERDDKLNFTSPKLTIA